MPARRMHADEIETDAPLVRRLLAAQLPQWADLAIERVASGGTENAIYRLGFATSRPQARQLVRHGHFLVNGKKVNIPSYSLKAGDVVTVKETSRENASILHAIEEVKGRGVPEWLSLDGQMGGKVMSMPTREQINLPVQEQLIVELYSK